VVGGVTYLLPVALPDADSNLTFVYTFFAAGFQGGYLSYLFENSDVGRDRRDVQYMEVLERLYTRVHLHRKTNNSNRKVI
jgi:hypothetical protein